MAVQVGSCFLCKLSFVLSASFLSPLLLISGTFTCFSSTFFAVL